MSSRQAVDNIRKNWNKPPTIGEIKILLDFIDLQDECIADFKNALNFYAGDSGYLKIRYSQAINSKLYRDQGLMAKTVMEKWKKILL